MLTGALIACALSRSALSAQTLEITNDVGVPIAGVQTVNVGEHVALRVRVSPANVAPQDLRWTVDGEHLKDWITRNGEPVPMEPGDYLRPSVHVLWRHVTTAAPNRVRVTGTVNGTAVQAEAAFAVERAPKAEKFYSDDVSMENHAHFHARYGPANRRGDLFLTWHRSQLDYFNRWREFFGYGRMPYWNPAAPWVTGQLPPELQHPSTIEPGPGFTKRHAHTPQLTRHSLDNPSEGEFDHRTRLASRGTYQKFQDAGYVLYLQTVREISGWSERYYSATGVIAERPWWSSTPGNATPDPWFERACPARSAPPCFRSLKTWLGHYSLREFGESIESGWYALDFPAPYHTIGHNGTSRDMASPITSMRDPIFWGWHSHLDSLLTRWQRAHGAAEQALVVTTTPVFSARWDTVRVTFSHPVVSEFVHGANLLVNGAPATRIPNLSHGGSQTVFEFTGFPIPGSGNVEVVVRRDANNNYPTDDSLPPPPPPPPTLIFTTEGNILAHPVNKFSYHKP